MTSYLCHGFSTEDWSNLSKQLDDNGIWSEAWSEAISKFKLRMEERYFSAIDALIGADTRPDKNPDASPSARHCIPGFSIMALCCLLIETLQDFRGSIPPPIPPLGPCGFPSGSCIKPPPGTRERFRNFLSRPGFAGAFSDKKVANAFIDNIRNGILHNAETRDHWVIWREEPEGQIVQKQEDGRYALNRTLFYESLQKEFESYLCELRDPDKRDLRLKFKEKMQKICNGA